MSCLVIATSNWVKKTPDGKYWTSGSYNVDFFQRYLHVFDSINVIARIQEAESVSESYSRVDSDKISIVDLPNFRGPIGALSNFFKLNSVFNKLVKPKHHFFLLRVPGMIQSLFWIHCLLRARKYGLEVIVDPALDYDPRSFGSKVGIIFKYLVSWILRKQCKHAFVTSYVTSYTLQKHYPPGNKNTYSFSSLDIGEEAFCFAESVTTRIKSQPDKLMRVSISFTGDLTRPYKGLDILLHALVYLKSRGFEVSLLIIGGGRMKDFYLDMISRLNLQPNVAFAGEICNPIRVYELLAESDVFVLPTRREGLPRAIIEAMAVGLPCISTNIAGIPEILDDEFTVDMDDQNSLNVKLEKLLLTKEQRVEASIKNAMTARLFDRSNLENIRAQFYQKLKSSDENS